jgi:hypothetical protein
MKDVLKTLGYEVTLRHREIQKEKNDSA